MVLSVLKLTGSVKVVELTFPRLVASSKISYSFIANWPVPNDGSVQLIIKLSSLYSCVIVFTSIEGGLFILIDAVLFWELKFPSESIAFIE